MRPIEEGFVTPLVQAADVEEPWIAGIGHNPDGRIAGHGEVPMPWGRCPVRTEGFLQVLRGFHWG